MTHEEAMSLASLLNKYFLSRNERGDFSDPHDKDIEIYDKITENMCPDCLDVVYPPDVCHCTNDE